MYPAYISIYPLGPSIFDILGICILHLQYDQLYLTALLMYQCGQAVYKQDVLHYQMWCVQGIHSWNVCKVQYCLFFCPNMKFLCWTIYYKDPWCCPHTTIGNVYHGQDIQTISSYFFEMLVNGCSFHGWQTFSQNSMKSQMRSQPYSCNAPFGPRILTVSCQLTGRLQPLACHKWIGSDTGPKLRVPHQAHKLSLFRDLRQKTHGGWTETREHGVLHREYWGCVCPPPVDKNVKVKL